MKTTITIGDNTFDIVINFQTIVLFRSIFNLDFLVESSRMDEKTITATKGLQELKKLQADYHNNKITQEEYLTRYNSLDIADSLEMVSEKSELYAKLLFVMVRQAEESDAGKLFTTTIKDYYDFLGKFEGSDLMSGDFTAKINAIWKEQFKSKVESKNH